MTNCTFHLIYQVAGYQEFTGWMSNKAGMSVIHMMLRVPPSLMSHVDEEVCTWEWSSWTIADMVSFGVESMLRAMTRTCSIVCRVISRISSPISHTSLQHSNPSYPRLGPNHTFSALWTNTGIIVNISSATSLSSRWSNANVDCQINASSSHILWTPNQCYIR